MEPYAVVETGGKQYRVKAGDTLTVEHLKVDAGAQTALGSVLALSDGKDLKIGTPTLPGVQVTATVLRHLKGPKVVAFKKKRRKGYKRKVGHRQLLTEVRVEALP